MYLVGMGGKTMTIHYGDGNGPVCGAHFRHEGLTYGCETWRVTCRRCQQTARFKAAAFATGKWFADGIHSMLRAWAGR